MTTVIDFSAAVPSAKAIKQAGHAGAVMYISPGRESWMRAKPVRRSTIDDFDNNGLRSAFIWQYGKEKDSDVMRGYAGGVADAKAAKAHLENIRCAGHPVFFAVDFDITLAQWNNTAVEYFKGVCSVLGKQRVGIYGHSRVVHWAMEDDVVAKVAPGRVLGWVTKAWSNGQTGSDYAVLYQKVFNTKGPDGVLIDISDVHHPEWGWRAIPGGTSIKVEVKAPANNSGYTPTKPQLCYPMKNGTYTRTSGYGPRWGTHHNGIDLAAPVGTPIYAAADGIVIEGKDRTGVAGFGSWIWLDCQASVGRDFIYGHVKHDGILVRKGDRVKKGQQIGVVGNEGQSTGPHLHFEVWGPPGRSGGQHENPDGFMNGAAQPGTQASSTPVPAPSQAQQGAKSVNGINLGNIKPNPNWRGDPVWLPEVLRAFGCKVEEYGDWKNIGHGDFGAIKGVFVHHTGTNKDIPGYIQHHPDLGLCSQVHLSRSGVWQIVGAGIAWHAGKGSAPGWPTNAANQVAIGIEAASDGISVWPKEQLDSYYRGCAAILWFLGKNATRDTLLAHWEYSNHVTGKWDPGAGNGKSGAKMNMDHFRAQVQRYIDAARSGNYINEEDELKPDERAALNEVKHMLYDIVPRIKNMESRQDELEKKTNDLLIQQMGLTQEQRKALGWETNPKGGRGWPQLGSNEKGQWLTQTDALAAQAQDIRSLGQDLEDIKRKLNK